MRFLLIKEVANTNVVSVDISSSILNAIDVMIRNNHRNIVIEDGVKYRIFTVLDVLKIQRDEIDLSLPISSLKLDIIPTISADKNILDTVEYLNNSMEYICAINDDNSLFGLITHTDITTHIDPHTLMDNYRLIDFLKIGSKMKTVSKDTLISNLLSEMVEGFMDHVVVVEDMKPIGILTTKDLMVLIKQKVQLDVSISKFMSFPVDSIERNASIKEALEFIQSKHYKRVVVVDEEGRLAGIVSQKELISLTYSKWAVLMKEYQDELREINSILENKNKEYETMASTDSLTGLYNRYKFSELYVSTYKSMVQRHNEMSLILLDIDYFKNVNDKYGHNIGDKVLVQVAHTLLKTLRNVDIVARWGGEEFVILLPTADLTNAYKIAEELRYQVQELEIDVAGHVTISLGVSLVEEGSDMDEVINKADQALYLAKASGRNCVKTQDDI
ncbi:diguanylate cyclase [Sulfurimonas sp.]|uniref:diguanylate cyclase n=1 Tax=Sulfurimonas sp. TaxID=2022749 RepID=UPI003568AEBD